jgi:hypothetical protein
MSEVISLTSLSQLELTIKSIIQLISKQIVLNV